MSYEPKLAAALYLSTSRLCALGEAEGCGYTWVAPVDISLQWAVVHGPWVNTIEVAEFGQEGWSTTHRATPCALSLLAAFPNESLRLRVGADSPMIHLDGVGPEPDEATGLA